MALSAGNNQSLAYSLEDENSIADCVGRAAASAPLDLVMAVTSLLHDDSTKPERSWRANDAA